MEIERKNVKKNSFHKFRSDQNSISFSKDISLSEEGKPKRKRRSKNDPEGRMFKCECGHGYLSQLALNNHKKSKHFHKVEVEGDSSTSPKKRGRPKKNLDIFNLNNSELHYNSFFLSDLRKKNATEEISISSLIEKVFREIYSEYKKECTLKVESPEEHPFIKLILSKEAQGYNSKQDNENEYENTCDEIFWKYLKMISKNTNKEYFIFAFKFILLFRECINKYKNIELENSKCILNESVDPDIREFTQKYDAEQAPEMCNEFISEFLQTAGYFGMKGELISEFSEMAQHLCYWLYENNFTSSKLILVSTLR